MAGLEDALAYAAGDSERGPAQANAENQVVGDIYLDKAYFLKFKKVFMSVISGPHLYSQHMWISTL